MQITAKYDVGATVYVLVTRNVSTPVVCTTCGSTGLITLAGKEFTCPDCGGRHTTSADKETVAQAVVVTRVLARKTGSETQIRYEGVRDGRGGIVVDEDKAFETKAAAEATIPAP